MFCSLTSIVVVPLISAALAAFLGFTLGFDIGEDKTLKNSDYFKNLKWYIFTGYKKDEGLSYANITNLAVGAKTKWDARHIIETLYFSGQKLDEVFDTWKLEDVEKEKASYYAQHYGEENDKINSNSC